ncbi:uncharacterized protein G2W53_010188 [Senna tora]|uniref:Uncharacterized protein n=1 Tax=Senna tora TaxID=362788 RepID=A0A834WZG7_9FABA|nr:uncharacterized protein G2W53_010188 [Senna tora]
MAKMRHSEKNESPRQSPHKEAYQKVPAYKAKGTPKSSNL